MLKLELSYRGLIAIGLALVSLWFFIRLWPVILLVITALIFMTALLPYVDWLVQRRLPRGAAVILLLIVVLAAIAGLFALVVPAMVSEFKDLRNNLPDDAKQLEDFLRNFHIDVALQSRARNVDWGSLVSGRVAVNYGQRVVATTLSILTIIFLTVYLLVEAPRLGKFLSQFIPPGREDEVAGIMRSLSRVVGGYIRGQVITSLAIAVYTLVVLLIVRAPNPVAFAVLAAFADVMPVIGATLSTVPPAAAAFHDSPTRAAIIFGLLVLYQQFEDRYLVPRVYGSTLNLPPLIVLIAVLAGGELLGIPGVLLALPAAAAGRVALDYWLAHRHAPEETPPPPASEDELFAPDETPRDAAASSEHAREGTTV
ncbi:MAG: AI-2E family transporter [Chloroflexota bacterium]|nr:AI-2E family transporter [Chloroflexota bacterium]